MNLTVEEALTRICPLTMGREEEPVEDCRADRCMAWRWSSEQVYARTTVELPEIEQWNEEHPFQGHRNPTFDKWYDAAEAFANELIRQWKVAGDTGDYRWDDGVWDDKLTIYLFTPQPRHGFCGLAGKSKW